MGRIFYIDGSILIKTRYFVPKELGCGYAMPPNAILLEPNIIVDGSKCLLIDDEHPQSLFDEYYAKDWVASESLASSYFAATYNDCIQEFKNRMTDICSFIKESDRMSERSRLQAYRFAYVGIITALESFVCYILLRRSLKSEDWFKELMFQFAARQSNKKDQWSSMIEQNHVGEWEQDAIRQFLRGSYLDVDRLDKLLSFVHLSKPDYDRSAIKRHFQLRHLLVHRSGKQMDDVEVLINRDKLSELLNDTYTMVGAIYDSLWYALDSEARCLLSNHSIDQIFPDGIVKAPFILSDLIRLVGNDYELSPEPISMPTL